jgi:hypothetical protein
VVGQAQLPLWQVCAAGHVAPQEPQLDRSVCSFTQAPLHVVPPPGQAPPLLPAEPLLDPELPPPSNPTSCVPLP